PAPTPALPRKRGRGRKGASRRSRSLPCAPACPSTAHRPAPSPVHRSACSPCAPDLLPPPPAGEGRGGGSRACPTHAAATPSACRHERLDLVGAARQAVGEHFVAVLRDRHVVLDPDPDATPLRGHAGVVGGYVEPRLD